MGEIPLTDGKVGQIYHISRIDHYDNDTQKLIGLGIVPHSRITIFREGSPYVLKYENTKIAIDQELIKKIFVYLP